MRTVLRPWLLARLALWSLALAGTLQGGEAASAREPPLVVGSRLELEVSGDRLEATLELETWADQVPTQPLSTLSGAGALTWASPGTGSRFGAPLPAFPDAPTLIQETPGLVRTVMRFGSRLVEGSESVFLRLPACPDGTWALTGREAVSGDPEAKVERTGPKAHRGRIPSHGGLRLAWGEARFTRGASELELAELTVTLGNDGVRFEARLRGYSARTSHRVELGPALRVEPAKSSGSGSRVEGQVLTLKPDGAELGGLPGGWFDLGLEGRIEMPGAEPVRIPVPRIRDLPAPRLARVRVVPEAPRRYQIGTDAGAAGRVWTERSLARLAREWTLAEPTPGAWLGLQLMDVPVPVPDVPVVERIQVLTIPSEIPRYPLVSRVVYRVASGGHLELRIPSATQIGNRVVIDGVERPATVRTGPAGQNPTLPLKLERARTVSLEVLHGEPDPAQGGDPGILPLSVPWPEQGRVDLLDWAGRTGSAHAVLGVDQDAHSAGARLAYPLRWIRTLADGMRAVARDAGVPLLLAAAALVAAYSYLFLFPPTRQAGFTVSAMLAALALAQILIDAARSVPPTGDRPGLGSDPRLGGPGDGGSPLFQRMRETVRQVAHMYRGTGEGEPGGGGGLGTSPGLDPRGGHGTSPGITGGGHPSASGHGSSGGPAGAEGAGWDRGAPMVRDPRGMVPGRAGESILGSEAAAGEAVGGVEPAAAEPPEDDWRVQRARPKRGRIDLRVASRGTVRLGAFLLLLLGVASVIACRMVPGPAGLIGVGAVAFAAIFFDLRFPLEGPIATAGLLLSALVLAGERGGRRAAESWERVRREIEVRRVREARGAGSADSEDEESYGRGPLRENEVTYEEVFREDDGITFLVEDGEAEAGGKS